MRLQFTTRNKQTNSPFEVGQEAESKSFLKGYRGSWFRCEYPTWTISVWVVLCLHLWSCFLGFSYHNLFFSRMFWIKEISSRKGDLGSVLRFIDFPDEKMTWTKIYQKPPISKSKSKEIGREIMVRPRFPPFFCESQMTDSSMISEVTVIMDDVWKVGNLVDWWCNNCYWSGKLTKVLGDDKAEIVLPDPPIGEGETYEVLCKDLRPSLDWSLECGWTVPVPKEGENVRPCARVVQPMNHRKIDEGRGGSFVNNSGIGKISCPDSVSSSLVRDHSYNKDRATSEKDQNDEGMCSKKMRTIGRKPSVSACSDSVEAAILDLEELANKVKWLKGILQSGTPLSNAMRPSWKFLEHREASTPK